jgi:GNAT superfamily N-acetyltransferase
MTPDLAAAAEATWPPRAVRHVGAFTLRDGGGGGQRVSAATAGDGWTPAALDALLADDGPALFRVAAGQQTLDRALQDRGFVARDATLAYVMAHGRPDPGDPDCAWPPAPDVAALWALGGIGAERLAVMDRVTGPRAALVCRDRGRPVAVGFAAVHGDWVILHALFAAPAARRRGHGRAILNAAGAFGAAQGATRTGLLVTAANAGARALYARAGMAEAGGYHYRQRAAA